MGGIPLKYRSGDLLYRRSRVGANWIRRGQSVSLELKADDYLREKQRKQTTAKTKVLAMPKRAMNVLAAKPVMADFALAA